jgi:hypothetical protein
MHNLVVLEGLKEGNRFFSINIEGKDPIKLSDGTIAYRVLGYADTDEEALEILRRGDSRSEKEIISEYLLKTGRGIFSKTECDNLSEMLDNKKIGGLT